MNTLKIISRSGRLFFLAAIVTVLIIIVWKLSGLNTSVTLLLYASFTSYSTISFPGLFLVVAFLLMGGAYSVFENITKCKLFSPFNIIHFLLTLVPVLVFMLIHSVFIRSQPEVPSFIMPLASILYILLVIGQLVFVLNMFFVLYKRNNALKRNKKSSAENILDKNIT